MKARILPQTAEGVTELSFLNPQAGVPGCVRMRVYADGYVARLHEALCEVFEAVRFVIGEQRFFELSSAYAKAYPSHDYNLSLAGRHFPAFAGAEALAASLPFIGDLATLEWRVCLAFRASLQPPLDPAKLAAIPADAWDRLQFYFQPETTLVASEWPLVDIWAARKQPREGVAIPVEGRPQRVLVYRSGLDVLCEPIELLQADVLAGLLAGKSLGQAWENALAQTAESDDSEEAPDVGAWFSRWMRQGLITDAALC